MKLEDTRITLAGVMRCCLQSVPARLRDDAVTEVEVGREEACEYCHTTFRLTEDKVWLPLWQMEGWG